MRPASLSTRISLLLVVTSLLLLGGGGMWMDWRIDHAMESRFRQNLLTQATALSAMIALEQDALGAAHAVQPQAGILSGDGRTYYELRCDGMPPLRSQPPVPLVPASWPKLADKQPRFTRLRQDDRDLGTVQYSFLSAAPENAGEDTGEHPAAAARSSQPRPCRLLFAQDRRAIDQIMLAVDWTLTLGPALALLIALIAVPLIVRRGLRPIGRLVERMRDIGPNAPGQRLAASGLRELDPLVARFNDVLGRMDDGLARERQFASGLAHETRTRLAELRALTEVESRYPSGRSLPELLTEIGSIGAELEATVTALLLLTRLQSGLEQPLLQPLPLAPWLDRQLQRQQGVIARRGLGVQVLGTPPACLHTDPALLEVVVGNLLGNACAYAPAGDRVTLQLTAGGLSLDNTAPELGAGDLANFGQRFWRKQLPHAGHAGLGLALASAAAHALGLRLDFRLGPEQRLHARLSWPPQMTRGDCA